MDLVFSGKSINKIISVFIYSSYQIIRKTNIQGAIFLTCEYVDILCFHINIYITCGHLLSTPGFPLRACGNDKKDLPTRYSEDP